MYSARNLSDNLPIIFAMTKRIARTYVNCFFFVIHFGWKSRNGRHFCNKCVCEMLKVHTSDGPVVDDTRPETKNNNKQKHFYYHPYGRKTICPRFLHRQNVNKNISTLWCGERTRARDTPFGNACAFLSTIHGSLDVIYIYIYIGMT